MRQELIECYFRSMQIERWKKLEQEYEDTGHSGQCDPKISKLVGFINSYTESQKMMPKMYPII